MTPVTEVNSPGVLLERRRFTWNIANFREIRRSNDLVKAQHFVFEMGQGIGLPVKFAVYLGPITCTKTKKRWARVYLKVLSTPEDKTDIIFRFETDVPTMPPVGFTKKVTLGARGWGSGLIPLYEPNWFTAFALTKNGSMPVDLCVTLYNPLGTPAPTLITPLDSVKATSEAKFLRQMAEDLQQMKKSASSTDSMVSLVSLDNVRFLQKKALLKARSSILGDLKSSNNEVIFTGIHSEALGVLTHFLNTGTLQNNWNNEKVIIQLTHAAHTYKLKDLKEFLDQVLGLVCTKENAGQLLVLAKKQEMKKAMNDLMAFVQQNLNAGILEQIMLESSKTGDGGSLKRGEMGKGIFGKLARALGF